MTSEQFWQMNVGEMYEAALAEGVTPGEYWARYIPATVPATEPK